MYYKSESIIIFSVLRLFVVIFLENYFFKHCNYVYYKLQRAADL